MRNVPLGTKIRFVATLREREKERQFHRDKQIWGYKLLNQETDKIHRRLRKILFAEVYSDGENLVVTNKVISII